MAVLCTSIVNSQNNVAVCLSGGGALGYAEIGALKALEESGIYPNAVAGCSMGSIVGVFYAAGYSPDSLWQIIEKEKMLKFSKIFSVTSGNKTGFSNHKTLRRVLKKYIHTDNFDSLEKQFVVCVTDIQEGKNLYISSGEHLHEYVLASASLPIAFESMIVEGRELVDGGVLSNFPIEALVDKGYDATIGIDVQIFSSDTTILSKIQKINPIFALLMEAQTKPKIHLCDFYIPIQGMNHPNSGTFDFKAGKENFDKGYEQTKQYIAEHPEILRFKK